MTNKLFLEKFLRNHVLSKSSLVFTLGSFKPSPVGKNLKPWHLRLSKAPKQVQKKEAFELAKRLGCFFVGNSVLMMGQFLKTSTDKEKMVRFDFLRFARFSWRNGPTKNQISKLA